MRRAAALVAILGCAPRPDPAPPPEPGWPSSPVVETVQVPGFSFELVRIPASAALRPFAIGAREVTWKEFNAFMGSTERRVDGVTRPTRAVDFLMALSSPDFFGSDRPVVDLRWHSAVTYCEWLSRVTGDYYRLPTEPEWEHAARSGSAADGPENPQGSAWYRANSEDQTHPPGGKRPNAFGLHDMLGNVWEYCLEPFGSPDSGPVVRGGCWSSPLPELRYAHRQPIPPQWSEADPNRPKSLWWLMEGWAGLRVVRVAGASTREARESYKGRLEVRILGQEEAPRRPGVPREFWRIVRGEVRNAGTLVLDEVEILVTLLDASGKPHRTDTLAAIGPGRPTFAHGWPVLANSAYEGPRAPLRPGETRRFEVRVPESFDDWDDRTPPRYGASVTNLRFSDDR